MVKVYNYLCNYSSNIIKTARSGIFLFVFLAQFFQIIAYNVLFLIFAKPIPKIVPILFFSDLVPYCS
jgi:hypothetical protein